MANGQITFSVVDGEPYVQVGADTARPFKNSNKIKSMQFTQTFYVTHKDSGTGSANFTLVYTLTPIYDDNDDITGINISVTGFGRVTGTGTYTCTDTGKTFNSVTYYD